MQPETQITLENVDKIYTIGDDDFYALKNINLSIPKGIFATVLGPSGSGKSTLLNLIGGMDRPSKGHIYYQPDSAKNNLTIDLAEANDNELTLYRRYDVGFVFQFYNLIPTLTVAENVSVASELTKNPRSTEEVLSLVGLEDKLNQFPTQLSGGQQQRVSIARAIAGNPKILLCDEPTGALDTKTSEQVLTLLQKINQELQTTVIMITHNRSLIKYGEKTIEIQDGELV